MSQKKWIYNDNILDLFFTRRNWPNNFQNFLSNYLARFTIKWKNYIQSRNDLHVAKISNLFRQRCEAISEEIIQ